MSVDELARLVRCTVQRIYDFQSNPRKTPSLEVAVRFSELGICDPEDWLIEVDEADEAGDDTGDAARDMPGSCSRCDASAVDPATACCTIAGCPMAHLRGLERVG